MKTFCPEFIKPGAKVRYHPSLGDNGFVCIVAELPRPLGESLVVRLCDLPPEYSKIHHCRNPRTEVCAASVEAIEPFEPPTVGEITAEHLKANGYDGLCNDDAGCGCGLGDLAPCDCLSLDCVAAYKKIATEADQDICDCEVGDTIYVAEKP